MRRQALVQRLSVSPRQVRVTFRHFNGGYAGVLPLKPGRLLPSEGRGQRFESSWVRHFSATAASAAEKLLAFPFALRQNVAKLFPLGSPPETSHAQ